MDFKRKCSRKPIKINVNVKDEELFAHKVCLYRMPLLEDVTLRELEEFTHERLKLYTVFEKFTNLINWKINLTTSLKSENLDTYLRLFGYKFIETSNEKLQTKMDIEARRKDNISHFILRFVFCQSSDMKRYFLQKEKDIFRTKFESLMKKDIQQYLQIYNINCHLISRLEKKELLKKEFLHEKYKSIDLYRIHFIHALPLVKLRQCILHKGYAFVNEKDLVEIFISKLQDEIEYGLQIACKLLTEIEEDSRIHYLLNNLRANFVNRQYILKKDVIPIEIIDEISVKSFPLCMRVAHEYLRKNHHHKYIGRLQYGLFLKGIGVTLEDSLRFWREEFIKRIDPERFDKRYAYGIRYNYGLEGRRHNCSPYSCNKIFSKNVGFNDTHGCPFKMYDPTELKSLLLKYNLTADESRSVVSYAYKGLPKIACRCYFNIKHESKLEINIESPNQYFQLSVQIFQLRNAHYIKGIQEDDQNSKTNYDMIENLNENTISNIVTLDENEQHLSKHQNGLEEEMVKISTSTHKNSAGIEESNDFELFEYVQSSSDES